MNQTEIAIARSRAYQLFSDLFLHGLTETNLPIVREVSELAEQIPSALDSDALAAAHYQLFGMNVFPYETIFLDTDGLLGGTISSSVSSFYQEIGFPVSEQENADHLGVELALLDFLCGAEADALSDKLPHEARRMRHFQRRFLDEHLLRWLPGLTMALQQQMQPFFAALATMTLELALNHRAALDEDLMNPPATFSLPESPDILNQEKTSLKDITAWLLTPVYTGFYLSRDDIGRMGDRYRLPRGFGQRQQTLTNLMRTAVDYDAFGDVLAALQELTEQWQAFYQAIGGQPAVTDIWLERLRQTQVLLKQVQTAAQEQHINIDELSEGVST